VKHGPVNTHQSVEAFGQLSGMKPTPGARPSWKCRLTKYPAAMACNFDTYNLVHIHLLQQRLLAVRQPTHGQQERRG
jgi:hypothetical protein